MPTPTQRPEPGAEENDTTKPTEDRVRDPDQDLRSKENADKTREAINKGGQPVR